MPYVGGHSRYEDQVESDSDSFISICKTTLKREIKEEIGISVALDSIKPIFIYTQAAETSKNHLAICFVVSVDEDSVKLRLDTQELILNRGKSKSGRFIEIRELHQNQDELEEWGKIILKEFFDLPFEQVQFDFDSM